MTVCGGGWSLVLSVVLLGGVAFAQGTSPTQAAAVDETAAPDGPRWYDLTLIAEGLVLVIPADWEQTSGGSWQLGVDRRFMVGWTPEAGDGPEALANGMKANIESTNPVSDVRIETVTDAAGEPLAYDLLGTSTDAVGKAHWQWTRLVSRKDGAVVLLAVQGDFADAERIAETREQLSLTLSSMLNLVPREADSGAFHINTATEQLSLGSIGRWTMIEQFWANPQIMAEADVTLGFLAAGVPAVSELLLAQARAGTRNEVQVESGDSGAGAHELVFRIVGQEEDEAEDGLAAFRNPRVRWARHRFVTGSDGTWILRALVDLRVTHADDFLDNAEAGLAPIFDGWAVTPRVPAQTKR